MRKINYCMIAGMAICLSMLASCLGSDDDNTSNYRLLTAAEKAEVLFNVEGDYEGRLYFVNAESKDDSLDIHYTINRADSVLTISDFDCKSLEHGAEVGGSAFSQVVGAAGQTMVKIVLHPYYNENFSKGYYTFSITGEEVSTVTYNDGTNDHTVSFTLGNWADILTSYGTTRYYGLIEYYMKQMQGILIIKSITADGITLNVNVVMGFNGRFL